MKIKVHERFSFWNPKDSTLFGRTKKLFFIPGVWLCVAMGSEKACASTVHVILIPGTSPQYISPMLPLGARDVHPALNDWTPHQTPPFLGESRNTGDAIVDMIKSRLPPGADLDVHLFARGAAGEKDNTWVGENSKDARQSAGNRLSGQIDMIPKDDLLI